MTLRTLATSGGMAEAPDTSAGEIGRLQGRIREFVRERDWDQFHDPKNLILALVGEVGELAEIFQWLTPDEASRVMHSDRSAAHVREELGDVLIYLVRLADVLSVDLAQAGVAKLGLNAAKYPADRVRGSAAKYSELGDDSG
jgi:dCTP diphosphatase